MKLSEMNEDELRALAKNRFKNGRLTKQALEAQLELWIRHDRPFTKDGHDIGNGEDFINLDYYDGNISD